MVCQSGGGVMKRHARLEQAVGGLIRRWTSQDPLFEQRVPSWDRTRRRASGEEFIERAILDVEYNDIDDSRRWIDVSVRLAAPGNAGEVDAAARRAGEAARKGERDKHVRYHGEQLTAFVVECGGRLGGEARQWLRRHVDDLPRDMQTTESVRAYKVISCAVQSRIARQLRVASGLK